MNHSTKTKGPSRDLGAHGPATSASPWAARCLPLLLLLSLTSRAAESSSGFQVQQTPAASAWTVLYEGRPLLVYEFDPKKFKPYVKELRTLRGDNVLRDAPFDHLHHHALMYGIKVNGINFWEEISGSGVQKSVATPQPVLGFAVSAGRRLPQATISQVLHWVAPQDAFLPDNAPVALLIERRMLVLTVNPNDQEVALEWSSQFEVGPKTNAVELTGSNYHGLGMRFLQDLDKLAVHSLAGAHPDLGNSRQDLSPAPWAAVSFDAPGHPATIALAGHPANARGEATWFSMLTPFAYLSATQALDKEPLIYHSGDKWDLRYLILLYPDAKPAATLQQRMDRWRTAVAPPAK
jgi:hypothetical protein